MKDLAAFRLDPVNQCLWRRCDSGAYERIVLTPTEFGVLDHLVEHAGRLITHRELLDTVWPHTVIEPQAVKSNIFRLRRLLDDDPRQPRFIETMPRRGYRFVGAMERGTVDGASDASQRSRLVGRAPALDLLRQHVQSAFSGKPQIVFITGEAGIGKSAVVEECERQAASSARAARTVRGQCVEGFGSKEPFYPVLEAVGALCRGPDATRIVGVLASHAPTWFVQFPSLLTAEHRRTLQQEILGATRERMLREICEALETIASSTPLLLVLEDLHWADSSTLDFISAMARGRIAARLMIIGTYRAWDVARSAQPLHELKRDLVARHLCHEMVLQPLSRADIALYLAHSDGRVAVPPALAELLHRHTEGNPLFMICVLDHLIHQGSVLRDHDAWLLNAPVEEIGLEVPESLRQMIGAQVERLGDEEQRVLEVGAIAGMSFTPAICAPAAGLDVHAFEACCDALASRAHILRDGGTRELPDGAIAQRFAFVHTLYQEALYERQSPARRAKLHRQCAERLEEVYAGGLDDVAPELAHHFEKGADWPRAVSYLRRAAETAANRCSIEGTRVHLQHALALAARLPLPDRMRVETEILDELADIYLGTFDTRAIDVLTLLRERAAEYGMIDVEAEALVALSHPLAWGDSAQALEMINQALRLSEAQTDPLRRAQTRAGCMIRRIWASNWSDRDAEDCRRALEEIRRLGDPDEVAWHELDCNFVDFFSSGYRKAADDANASLAVLARGGRRGAYLSYAHSLKEFSVSWSLTLLGEWGAAFRETDTGIALARKNGDIFRCHTLQMIRAWALLCAMDFHGARAEAESMLPHLHERPPWRRFCLVLAGAADTALGEHERAFDRLLAAGDDMDRRTTLGDWYWRLVQRWALTNLRLARRELVEAREAAEQFLATAEASAEVTWQALAWDASARTALAANDLARAKLEAEHALSVIDRFEAPVAAWQAHATAATIARLRGDTSSAADHAAESRRIVLKLAASLGPDADSLRQIFVGSAAVASVLGRETNT